MTITKTPVNSVLFSLGVFSMTPELFIGYSLLQLSLYSIAVKLSTPVRDTGSTRNLLPNYSVFGAFTFILASALIFNETNYHGNVNSCFNSSLTSDYISFVTKEVICLASAFFFLSLKPVRASISLSNSFEYYSFAASASLGSMLLCSSNDFITAYLSIELQSISFYLMACSKKNSNYSIESGLKYFIIGSFSSAILLLGTSFVYLNLGTLNFFELELLTSVLSSFPELCLNVEQVNLKSAYTGFFLIGISVFIKLAVAPFHLWSIDVYESSPTTTTYFFAVIPKLGLFVFLVKVFYTCSFYIFLETFSTHCLFLSLISIFVGSLGGVEQRRLKSLMAYSSVGHTGYALLSFSSGVELGVVFTLYYLVFYMLSSLCFWLVFTFLKQKVNSEFGAKFNKELGDLALLSLSNPMLSVVLGITLFSLAGVPPLIGFLIKFGAFFSLVHSSAYLAAFLGILLTIISTFYYLRMVKIIFFENLLVGRLYYPINTLKASLIAITFFSVIIFFIKPSFMYLAFLKAYLLTF